MSNFTPELKATGIGSLPMVDPESALELIFNYCPDIPFWPQFPKISKLESMIAQYASIIPIFDIDGEGKVTLKDADTYGTEFVNMIEWISKDDIEKFAFNPSVSIGYYSFLEKAKDIGFTISKGHITGPLTLASSVYGEDGKYILYNEDIINYLPQALGLCGAWQAERLANLSVSGQVIIFIDEPVLSDYGSSAHTISLGCQEIQSIINTTVEKVKTSHAENVKVGMHICGNSMWDEWLKMDIDIINFDAFKFKKNFLTAHKAISAFIDRGGVIAFGIIPTTKEDLQDVSKEKLVNIMKSIISDLTKKGINQEKLIRQSMLTPACGYGSKEIETAFSGFKLLNDVSISLRKEYGILLS